MSAITIDARMLGSGGIGSYLSTLLGELIALPHEHELHSVVADRAIARFKEQYPAITPLPIRCPVYSPFEHFLVPLVTPRDSLLHVPHYNAPLLFRGPLVITVHDLIHIQFPGHFRFAGTAAYARALMIQAVRRARNIIAVSQATKLALMELLRVPDDKIHVIPNKVASSLLEANPAAGALTSLRLQPREYFLHVGALRIHKNIPGLLKAFRALRRCEPSARLVMVAYNEDRRYEVSRLLRCPADSENILVLRNLSEAILKALYQNAIALVMPSFVEGFCLPALEALALGTPVLASNIASLTEVAGDAALYFDPQSPEELVERLLAVARSASTREGLIAKGHARARLFASVPAGAETLGVYQAALG